MVKLTSSPNPKWKPGTASRSAVSEEMESFDFKTLGIAERYGLMVGAIVPRPIALVSTQDSKGNVNLAPFSFFNGISSDPPIVMISVANHPKGGQKDTAQNILNTKEFVVNSSSEWAAEAIHQSSADYEPNENEFELTGLTPVPSKKISPPRVKEAAVQMECALVKSLKFGDHGPGSVTVFFGEILMLHASKTVCKGSMILIDDYQPLSRLGGPFYGKTTEIFQLPRAKR